MRKVMFNQLSDQTSLIASLQKLSAAELVITTANLQKLILSLNVDAKELLANRRSYGALLGHQPLDPSANNSAKSELSTLLASEKELTNAINSLCLTEAILVRDTLSNALEIITELQTPKTSVTNQSIKPLIATSPAQAKKQRASNVTSIHLVEVKQRLTQALQPKKKQQQEIKDKLNGLLTTKTDHSRKKVI
jgi:hypothetical protein